MTELDYMRLNGWTYSKIAKEVKMTVAEVKQCFAQALHEERFE